MLEAPGQAGFAILDDESPVREVTAGHAQHRLRELLDRQENARRTKTSDAIDNLLKSCAHEFAPENILPTKRGSNASQFLRHLKRGNAVYTFTEILQCMSADSNVDELVSRSQDSLSRISKNPYSEDGFSFHEVAFIIRALHLSVIMHRPEHSQLYIYHEASMKSSHCPVLEFLDSHAQWYPLYDKSLATTRIAGSTMKSSVPPAQRQPILPMRLRVQKLCLALDSRLALQNSSAEVRAIHLQMFPTRAIPRFLMDSREAQSPSSGSRQQNTIRDVGLSEDLLDRHLESTNSVVFDELPKLQKSLPKYILNCLEDVKADTVSRWQFLSIISEDQSFWPTRNASTHGKHNLDVRGVLRIAADCHTRARFVFIALFALRHIASCTEFVASVLLWLTCLNIDDIAWQVLLSTAFWRWNESNWVDETKVYHDDWRKNGICNRSGELAADASWTQMLYMQCLYGRGGIEVDWSQEFRNKANIPENILQYVGGGWSAAAATETICASIREVMSTAYPRATPQGFDTFMDNAYEWLVSGSSAGIPSVLRHSEMRELILKEYRLFPRPTKRSVMERIPRTTVLDILQTSPKIVAKAHMKLNETGGKARAIYGVTIWHYIFSNWLLAPVERYIRHPNVDIGLPNVEFVKLMLSRAEYAREGAVFSSYDYPDFNAMHSHAHMAYIYRTAQDLALNSTSLQGMSELDKNLISATFDWLEASTYRQFVLMPNTDEIIQTCGGLYSGNRDTTLINTLLNVAYAKVVDESLDAMQCPVRLRMRLCHGDDIVSVFSDYPTAVAWNEVATHCRLKGQEKKLLTDESYHEYLRVMGCKDGVLRGCLARCVATFVNGNWETDRSVGLGQKAQEIYSNISTMYRRGSTSNVCQSIWKHAFFHFCRKSRKLSLNSELLWKRIIGHGPNGPNSFTMSPTDKFDRLYQNMSFRTLPGHITFPYLRQTLSQIPSWIEVNHADVLRMIDYLQKGTYGTELVVSFQDHELLTGIDDLPILTFEDNTVRQFIDTMTFQQCQAITDSIPLETRLKRRISAVFTILKCLHLQPKQELDLLAVVAKADRATVLKVLEIEGLIKSVSICNFDAVPELKALESSVIWTRMCSDSVAGGRSYPEISAVGNDFCARPIRSLLRY